VNQLLKEFAAKLSWYEEMLDREREILSKAGRVLNEPTLTLKKRQPITQHDAGIMDAEAQFEPRKC
jgi:hypothetical protein